MNTPASSNGKEYYSTKERDLVCWLRMIKIEDNRNLATLDQSDRKGVFIFEVTPELMARVAEYYSQVPIMVEYRKMIAEQRRFNSDVHSMKARNG